MNTESRRAVSQWFLMNGFVTASWVAHVPRQSAELGASPGALGLALLCMALGSVVGMAVAPRAIGRFGSGRVAWTAGGVYALLLPLPLLAGSVPALGLALLCFGAVHGLMDVTMNAAAAAGEKALGRPVMAGFHGWFSIGMVVGVGGGVAALAAGLSPLGHAAVAIGLAAALLLSGRPVRGFVPPLVESRTARKTGIDRRVVALAGLAFACLFLEGAMADWAGLLAVTFGAGPAVAPLAYGSFTAAWAGGRFLGDRLTTVAGDVAVVRAGGLLAAAGIAIALLGGTPGWVAAGCGVIGLGLANAVPVLFRAAAMGDTSGRGLALVTGVGYFGFLVGPPLVGFTAEAVGLPRAMLLVVAGGLVLAAGAFTLRPRRIGREVEGTPPDLNEARTSSPYEEVGNHERRQNAGTG
ncbi:MFS transporter [Limnoglobus roseus]|nr:MFS transporter [Limnoglobus roseus]